MRHRVGAERTADSLAAILRQREMRNGQCCAKRESRKQISGNTHFPHLRNRPELLVIMTAIARNRGGWARRGKMSRDALGSAAIAAFMLIMSAVASPMLASAASDPSPPDGAAQPAHPHKHRHLPTPAPTPMALPPEIKAKVPAYKAGPMPFHDGEQLIYQASWVGIPAAQARLEFHQQQNKDPHPWLGEIWIETNAFADLFYKMRAYMKESMA